MTGYSKIVNSSGIVAFTAALAVLIALVLFPIFPSSLRLREGSVVAGTIVSPRGKSFESKVLTKQRRDEAAAGVADVVVYDAGVRSQQLQRLSAQVDQVTQVRNTPNLGTTEKAARLDNIEGLKLSQRARLIAVGLDAEQWGGAIAEADRVLRAILGESIAEQDVAMQRGRVRTRIDPGLTSDQMLLVEELVQPLVIANLKVDQEKTQQARDRARAEVLPVQVNLAQGQVIARQGDIVNAATIEALKEVGLLENRVRSEEVTAVALMGLLTALILGIYLLIFRPSGALAPRELSILALLVVLWVVTARFYFAVVLPDGDRLYLAYLLPMAAASMLVASLLDASLGVVVGVVLAFLAAFAGFYLPDVRGVAGGNPLDSLQMAVVYAAASLAGVYGIYRAQQVGRYLLAGVGVAAASFIGLLAFWLLDPKHQLLDIPWMALASGVSGLLSAMITIGAFITLGLIFGITTRFQLMELAQLSHPLLRRLQEKAPGTFHHSVIVGNLAERAADVIGADPLLARVGCYYHDIGKVLQPAFYIENQLGGENPHNYLEPEVSARIISDHVRRGLELARRHRLPSQVRDFIAQHHGTRLVTYFYRKAAQERPEVDPATFAYPGPRPRSRETAIVMLADSVEAVVRSSADRSPEAIDNLIDSVLAERMAEGQLDESPLTLRQLREIGESFKMTLRGVYHPRIEYPAPTPAERERVERASRLLESLPVPMDGTATPEPPKHRA